MDVKTEISLEVSLLLFFNARVIPSSRAIEHSRSRVALGGSEEKSMGLFLLLCSRVLNIVEN